MYIRTLCAITHLTNDA